MEKKTRSQIRSGLHNVTIGEHVVAILERGEDLTLENLKVEMRRLIDSKPVDNPIRVATEGALEYVESIKKAPHE